MNEIMAKIARLLCEPGVQIDAVGFIFALATSFVAALAISALYQHFYENRATGAQVHRAFPLLGPAITAIFIAIQFSLPLSLGLLGALSLIRFRTPIKEPEECAFIMLLVAAAVICATFQFLLLGVLLAVALVALLAQQVLPNWLNPRRKDGVLLVTLNSDASSANKEQIRRLIEERIKNGRLESISYSENLTSMYFSFSGLAEESVDTLHAAVAKNAPVHRLNVFFNAHGAWG